MYYVYNTQCIYTVLIHRTNVHNECNTFIKVDYDIYMTFITCGIANMGYTIGRKKKDHRTLKTE